MGALSFPIWGFPKIRATILGVTYNKDYSILGSILGSPILGNYHIAQVFGLSRSLDRFLG